VGFFLGSLILSESWPLWHVIPLALVLAAPLPLALSSGMPRSGVATRRDGSG
jgi:hypothetical protein